MSCDAFNVGLVIVYIRYKHVHQFYRTLVTRLGVTNTVAYIFGIITVFGLIMVGSFQVRILWNTRSKKNSVYYLLHINISSCKYNEKWEHSLCVYVSSKLFVLWDI